MAMKAIQEHIKYRFEDCMPFLTPQDGANLDTIKTTMGLELAERVSKIEDVQNNYETWLVDLCIQAKIPSKGFRAAQKHYWSNEALTCRNYSLLGLSGIVVCGTGAIVKRSDRLISAALAVFAVASTLFALVSYARKRDASHQVDGWSVHPAERVALNRTEAYAKGLPFVMRQRMREGHSNLLLLPIELEHLFNRHCDLFFDKLLKTNPTTDEQQTAWLQLFTLQNPVSKYVLEYVFKNIPQKYVQISKDYEALRAQLNHIRQTFNETRQTRQLETQRAIESINHNRSLAYAPIEAAHYYWSTQAQRDLTSKKISDQQYREKMQQYVTYRLLARGAVDAIYNAQVSAAESQFKTILQAIKTQEEQAYAPYYAYARGLLEHLRTIQTTHADYQSQPVPQNLYDFPAAYQAPTAPPAEFVFENDPPGLQDTMRSGYHEYLQAPRNQ